jgi:hypothetical protein
MSLPRNPSIRRDPAFAARLDALLLTLLDRAEGGDAAALRLLVRTCLPASRPISFEAGDLGTLAGCARTLASLLAAVAEGRVTPREAALVLRMLEFHVRLLNEAEAERGAQAAPAARVPAPEKKQRNTMGPAFPDPTPDPLEALFAELAPPSPARARRAGLMTSAAPPVRRAA